MRTCYLTLMLLFTGCEVVGPEYQGVFGSVTDSSVLLSNRHGVPVYFIAYGKQPNLEVDWFPGISTDNEILHGKTKEIPLEEIFLSETSEEIVVHWWDAQLVDRQRRAGEIRHFIIKK